MNAAFMRYRAALAGRCRGSQETGGAGETRGDAGAGNTGLGRRPGLGRQKGTGYVEDSVARTDAACLIDIHLKRTSYREALRNGRLALDGPRQLTGAFMTWIRPSPYAGIAAAPSARPSPGPGQD
jgi:hypothetical protein